MGLPENSMRDLALNYKPCKKINLFWILGRKMVLLFTSNNKTAQHLETVSCLHWTHCQLHMIVHPWGFWGWFWATSLRSLPSSRNIWSSLCNTFYRTITATTPKHLQMPSYVPGTILSIYEYYNFSKFSQLSWRVSKFQYNPCILQMQTLRHGQD